MTFFVASSVFEIVSQKLQNVKDPCILDLVVQRFGIKKTVIVGKTINILFIFSAVLILT